MTISNEPTHGGVTDEMMERFFTENPNLRPLNPVGPASTATEPAEPDPSQPTETPESVPQPREEPSEGGPTTSPEPAIPGSPSESPSTQPAPAPAPDDDFVDLNGTRYARSQLDAAAQFQQHLASDPQLARLITDYLTGSTMPAPAPTQPAPAPATAPDVTADIDMDDPSMRAIYGLIQQQNEQINQLTAGLRTTYDASIQSQRQQIDSSWNTALHSFAKDHELEVQDVESISQVAARLGVLPQLMAGVDPITGTPHNPDPVSAFQRALEIAMYQIPEYRDREFRRSVTTMQGEAAKRKLLGAVGGTSGSVARSTPPPKPGSPEAKRAMLAEVGAMLNGDWSDPTAN